VIYHLALSADLEAAPIELDAVVEARRVERGPDGALRLPGLA
jgi:hypothetical protein